MKRNERGDGEASVIIGGGCLLTIFLVAVVFFSLLGVGLTYGWDWFTAPFKGAQAARQIIQADGNFRIQAYTKFYNDCASIQGKEAEIDAQIVVFGSVPTDSRDATVFRTNIAGLEGDRGRAIAQYNQDSHKKWTEAQFKSEYLPYQIPTGNYSKFNQTTKSFSTEGGTTCAK